jgi:hypothetical protein
MVRAGAKIRRKELARVVSHEDQRARRRAQAGYLVYGGEKTVGSFGDRLSLPSLQAPSYFVCMYWIKAFTSSSLKVPSNAGMMPRP